MSHCSAQWDVASGFEGGRKALVTPAVIITSYLRRPEGTEGLKLSLMYRQSVRIGGTDGTPELSCCVGFNFACNLADPELGCEPGFDTLVGPSKTTVAKCSDDLCQRARRNGAIFGAIGGYQGTTASER